MTKITLWCETAQQRVDYDTAQTQCHICGYEFTFHKKISSRKCEECGYRTEHLNKYGYAHCLVCNMINIFCNKCRLNQTHRVDPYGRAWCYICNNDVYTKWQEQNHAGLGKFARIMTKQGN